VRAAEQDRDTAVADARNQVAEASARAPAAEQETARARQTAESAAAKLDRVLTADERQPEQIRADAAREREHLRQAHTTAKSPPSTMPAPNCGPEQSAPRPN